jgi:hypothetical protein
MTALPLASASQRLRKPGRPRNGQRPGIADSPTRMNSRPGSSTLDGSSAAPRLLDLVATAAYLGVSPWTVRDLEAAGTLHRVRVPLAGGRELRKLLFDVADLDRLIAAWKA